MNATILLQAAVLMLAMLILGSGVVQAGPKKQRPSDRMLINETEERSVYVVGSHIPQRVKLRSIGTNTPYNVRIYTQRELLSTGRQTPGEAPAVLDPPILLSGRR